MKISMTVGYAISALIQLASHPSDSPLSTAVAAARTGMPERYLFQVMKSLKDAGLVAATRGLHGGYRLAKPANRITLLEICEAVDGPLESPADEVNGMTAASQMLFAGTFADVVDDARRRLSYVTIDKLQAAEA